MLDYYDRVNQVVYSIIVLVALVVICVKMNRIFSQSRTKHWSTLFVGIYNIVILLLFWLGMVTQANSEGFGFIPLWALTLPWSVVINWFIIHSGMANYNFAGSAIDSTYLINFIIFIVLSGPINSCILFVLLKRMERKAVEDEAWDQARRNR